MTESCDADCQNLFVVCVTDDISMEKSIPPKR